MGAPDNINIAKGSVSRSELAGALRQIAVDAGAAIMPFFKSGTEVREKDDQSPVTDADEAAEAVILKALGELAPEIPVIAEEAMSAGKQPEIGARFFLVDPLDGTREFISGRGEFTVNIALVESGEPVLGVVYAPALGRLFYGAVGSGAFEEAVPATGDAKSITVRDVPEAGYVAVASRSHRSEETDEYLKSFKVQDFVSAGSSLKFCLVATGEADIYPRHGRTMEWDTAAGHAVLSAAGGSVTKLDDSPFTYGKTADGFANTYFVARGK